MSWDHDDGFFDEGFSNTPEGYSDFQDEWSEHDDGFDFADALEARTAPSAFEEPASDDDWEDRAPTTITRGTGGDDADPNDEWMDADPNDWAGGHEKPDDVSDEDWNDPDFQQGYAEGTAIGEELLSRDSFRDALSDHLGSGSDEQSEANDALTGEGEENDLYGWNSDFRDIPEDLDPNMGDGDLNTEADEWLDWQAEAARADDEGGMTRDEDLLAMQEELLEQQLSNAAEEEKLADETLQHPEDVEADKADDEDEHRHDTGPGTK